MAPRLDLLIHSNITLMMEQLYTVSQSLLSLVSAGSLALYGHVIVTRQNIL